MPEKFNGRWVTWPFDDHNPCPLAMFGLICESIKTWLDVHPKNVAAIHCKAGKGRTGTIICALLLHLKMVKTAEESMALYAKERTKNDQGVTIKSQQRYVRYYNQLLNKDAAEKEEAIEKKKKVDKKEEEKEEEKGEEKTDVALVPTVLDVADPGIPAMYHLVGLSYLNLLTSMCAEYSFCFVFFVFIFLGWDENFKCTQSNDTLL